MNFAAIGRELLAGAATALLILSLWHSVVHLFKRELFRVGKPVPRTEVPEDDTEKPDLRKLSFSEWAMLYTIMFLAMAFTVAGTIFGIALQRFVGG